MSERGHVLKLNSISNRTYPLSQKEILVRFEILAIQTKIRTAPAPTPHPFPG